MKNRLFCICSAVLGLTLGWADIHAQTPVPLKKGYVVESGGKEPRDLSFVFAQDPAPTKAKAKEFPQVNIPQEFRTKNFADRPDDGNCMWVSIDTLLKNGGYDVSLSKYRWGGTNGHTAYYKLQQFKVPTIYKPEFSAKDPSLLEQACNEELGAVVTIHKHRHALNLLGIDEKRVGLLDNNDPELKIRPMDRERFMRMWDGGALVILKKGYDGPLAKQCPGGVCPAPQQQFAPQFQPQQQFQGGSDIGAIGKTLTAAPVEKPVSEEEAKAFYKDLGYSDAKINEIMSKPSSGIAKQMPLVDVREIRVGDSTPHGKVVKVELKGNKRIVTVEEPQPEEIVIVKRMPANANDPVIITTPVPAIIFAPPVLIRDTPKVVSRRVGPLGINESVTYSDGVVVEYGLFGKRVYYPR